MTSHYQHLSQDERWVERAYMKLMETSQSLSTRVVSQLCNIIPVLEEIRFSNSFYIPELYMINKIKFHSGMEKSKYNRVVKYLNQAPYSQNSKYAFSFIFLGENGMWTEIKTNSQLTINWRS